MSRYRIDASAEQPEVWVLTDTEAEVVIQFQDKRFNETMRVTPLNDMGFNQEAAINLARITHDMGEWVSRHHGSKCFKQPYVIEYSEDNRHRYLVRSKSPCWRLRIDEETTPERMAASLHKAAEYVKRSR